MEQTETRNTPDPMTLADYGKALEVAGKRAVAQGLILQMPPEGLQETLEILIDAAGYRNAMAHTKET